MSGDRWWTCTHDGIGLPGCPTCDGRFPGPRELSGARNVIAALGTDQTVRDVLMLDAARGYLRDARDEIARLTAERDTDRLAGRLRVLDMLLESDGYVVCGSCSGHGTVYVEAAGDDATCNDCRGKGYVYADGPAPNRWRNVEGDTWWRPDADCHVWRTANVWWWALGSGDTLRCGHADSYDEARQDADDYIAGMWAERIQDPPACRHCYDSGIAATVDGEAMDCDCGAGGGE